ncbi:MAG: DapH/DapD/GlmU-related protein [Microbacteriaceae bacterium]|nr:DapH/DapD/GlmU-related protein [Microbacteriaceae bacterium]
MSLIAETAFIGEGVTLGENVKIGPGAALLGPLTVGDNVYIGANTVIGAPPEISSLPQRAAWAGELDYAGVEIADDAVIREGVIIHQGSHRPVKVGKGAWILNRAYLAHDVQVGAAATISAGVSIGGHCTIGAEANLGMNVVVHQRRIIGTGAMVGMGAAVTADVPPFAKAFGSPLRLHGINAYKIRQLGLDEALADELWALYNTGSLLQGKDDLPSNLAPLSEFFADWQSAPEIKQIKLSQGA